MDFRGKCILIVGASSGMGRGVAIRLAADGARVAVTARRQLLLDRVAERIRIAGGECFAIAADARDEVAAAGVVEAVITEFGRIDMVLLNAGGAPALDLRTMTAADVKDYMRSNYDVVVNYLMPVLHQMMKQRSGIVAQTNSLAGFLGVPLQGPYSAAKGAARLLFDAARVEFGSYGIKFLSIYPGFVATEQTLNDGMPAPMEISEDTAVRHIHYALRKEKTDYLFPFRWRWLVRLARILPKSVTGWVMGKEIPPLPGVP